MGHITFINFDAPQDEINKRLLKRENKTTVTDGRVEIAEKQRSCASMPAYDLQIITTGSVADNVKTIYKYLTK